MAKTKFKTEVNQLLDLLIHSLYSHSEIFLRELVSNSSDALDKLKYLTLTDDNLKSLEFSPRIDIRIEGKGENTLVIEDNGIGMNKQDLSDSLGTIARSGTRSFLENLSGDTRKDSNLIGRFGVGFYSCFMVADKVEVISRRAGEQEAWKWSSDGKSGYTISEAERGEQGTTVILFLNENGKEYGSRWQARSIVKKYSDHIAFPIFLHWLETVSADESGEDSKKEKEEKKEEKEEQINSAAALWKRPKSEIESKDYNEFYQTIAHDTEDPLLHIHTQAEGTLEYTTLFFIPKKAPIDMFRVDYSPGVKLYVKRVFITDDEKELLPTYLRFVRGIIDSEDLPLNVSREILQQNRIMTKIREASVKKILQGIEDLSKKEKEYDEFINQYNRPLKEGLYSDWTHKEDLLKLVRFKSTSVDGWTSLKDYRDRMPENQKSIYYLPGDNEDNLRKSPLLKAYSDKGFEVLIMAEDIDEVVMPMVGKFDELDFQAINRSGAMDDLKSDDDKKKEDSAAPVLKRIKDVLGDLVKEVSASVYLSEVPSCIVSDDSDPSAHMQQMLKAMGQNDVPEAAFILEVNPDHEIVKKLAEISDTELENDISHLLYEQALLTEGVVLKDPPAFVRRLNRVTELALK